MNGVSRDCRKFLTEGSLSVYRGCPKFLGTGKGKEFLAFDFVSSGATKKNGELITIVDEVRSASVVLTYMARDENVQVNGFIFLCDMSDLSPRHMTLWSMDDMKKWSNCWQVSL